MLLENQEGDIKLSAAMEEYLKKVRSPYSVGIPFDTKEVIEEAKKNKTYNLSFFKRKFRAIFKYMGFFFMPAPLNYLKQKDKNFEYSKMSYLKFLKICKFDAEAKKRKLLTYYHKLAKSVSLERPYVYVPLHYQPEKTTSPDGGVFVNHQLMLDMLSKSIPSDWSIYVKEHIYQLNPYSLGERSRSFTFYDDILSLPNVKLVPLSVSPFDLMDNAKAIATVTGTSGLEALIRSRPVFIFGYVWYRGCEGAFYTPTLKDLKETIAKIEKGYQVDHQKVRTFMAALEQVCFRGYSDLLYKRVLDISEEDNITALAKAVQQTYYGKQNNHESVCSMTK
jgi:hypothetical protein